MKQKNRLKQKNIDQWPKLDTWFQYSVQGADGDSLCLEAFQHQNKTTVHSPTKDWDQVSNFFSFSFLFFLFNSYQPVFVAAFSHRLKKNHLPTHYIFGYFTSIDHSVHLAEQEQISKKNKIRLDFCSGKLQHCAVFPVFSPFPPPYHICFHP